MLEENGSGGTFEGMFNQSHAPKGYPIKPTLSLNRMMTNITTGFLVAVVFPLGHLSDAFKS